MSITRDKARGQFVFEFDRWIGGVRIRARKRLPRAWNQAQADQFDRKEGARLYATANGVGSEHRLIEDAVALYLKERIPKLKQGMNVARELFLISPFYSGRPLGSLADVCKALRLKSKSVPKVEGGPTRELSPATIRLRIRYLTAACRWAWKHHSFGEFDPAAKVVVPQVRNERQIYIDRAQMLAVAKLTKNKNARMVVRMAFYSGMRLSEILRAISLGDRWHLSKTKNEEPRIVPIHPRVAVCARRFKKIARITVQKNVKAACVAAGMPWLHFHDLRHSTASEMVNAGVDLYTVGAVLGHKDPRSTARYAHLSTTRQEIAIGKVGQKVPHHWKHEYRTTRPGIEPRNHGRKAVILNSKISGFSALSLPLASQWQFQRLKADMEEESGYWCVVCGRFLASDDGVIVHDDLPHPADMAFDEQDKPQ